MNMATSGRMAIMLWAWVICGVALLAGFATLTVPTPPGVTPIVFHGGFATSSMITILNAGAAGLFVVGLHGFTRRLKLAYAVMCLGFIFQALAFIQVPVLNVFRLGDTLWSKGGFIILPFILTALLVYYGTRSFARLFGVGKWWTSGTLAQIIAIAMALILTVLPHAPWHQPEYYFDVSVALTAFTSLQFVFAALLAFLVARQAGTVYQYPMRMLGWALGAGATGAIIQDLAAFFIPNGIDLMSTGIGLIPNVLGGFLLIWAAVAFNAIANNESATPNTTLSNTHISIDAIIFLAGLASNRSRIDQPLDVVRAITAGLDPKAPIAPADQSRLAQSYTAIESYLTTSEPVRHYDLPNLRQLVERKFGTSLTGSSFWQLVKKTRS